MDSKDLCYLAIIIVLLLSFIGIVERKDHQILTLKTEIYTLKAENGEWYTKQIEGYLPYELGEFKPLGGK